MAQARALWYQLHQLARHGYLAFRLFREAHADGVANALGKQRPYAQGRLYPAVLALACLCHPEVQRIVHALGVHGLHQHAHRVHHHHGVRCLDADDHVVEGLAAENPEKLHAALHNALRRVAVARHYAVGQRAVVHTYAHSRLVLPANIYERHQPPLYPLKLIGIFPVGILQTFERAPRVHIVSRVYAHLLAVERRHLRRVGREVHVGHQGLPVPLRFQPFGDVPHVLRLARALRGEAHQLTPRIHYALGLRHAALRVVGVHSGHRLYSYRVVAPYGYAAHMADLGLPPLHTSHGSLFFNVSFSLSY